MSGPARSAALRAIVLPDFLVPAFATRPRSQAFSSSARCRSRIGAAPLSVPPNVEVTLLPLPSSRRNAVLRRVVPPRTVEVKGPLGTLNLEIPPFMSLDQNAETRKATLAVQDKEERKQREMWGTTRALLNNHILGVSEGHTAILRFVGVGYRALLEPVAETKKPEYEGQQFVILKLGYAHPVELGVPKGVKVTIPQPTRILLEGPDRHAVTQFAAEIRSWKKPEPYKGKGIFVNGETIKLKAKKIK